MPFEKILQAFIVNEKTAPLRLEDVIDNYEFTAYILSGPGRDIFALVEGADTGRVHDIAAIIQERVAASEITWCVLKKSEHAAMERFHTTTPPRITEDDLYLVTAHNNHVPFWLLQAGKRAA